MRPGKKFRFIYAPAGWGKSRSYEIPAWGLLAAGAALLLFLIASVLYVVDLSLGVAWRPGGSPLVEQHDRLRREATSLEHRLAAVQGDLDQVFAYQQAIAAAVDIEPLDAQVRAAGSGGRAALFGTSDRTDPPMLADVETLLRRARIQRSGMAAILDTLAARQDIRDRLPSIRPCDIGWISSRFGMRRDPFTGKQSFHRGLDFSLPRGTPVRSTADGIVIAVEKQRGLGRLIKIDHGGGVVTLYGHLQKAMVTRGQEVTRGEVIALSGSSGRSTAPHLHYEVQIGGRAVNPLTYILDSYAEQR